MDSEFDLTANLAEFRFYGTKDRRQWTWEGRKMVQIIKNITAESEKAGYNPEIDTNWCHLPMEMREKCIKEMDFKTRTRIRAASSIEKSYVDAHVYHFDKAIYDSGRAIGGDMFSYPNHYPLFASLEFIKSDPLAASGIERVFPKLYPIWRCETYVNTPPFKFCDFQELQCNMKSIFLPDYLDKWVTECGPFRFKTLRCKGGNFEIFEYFLKNSWDGVEEIFLDLESHRDFSIESVLCPSFVKAKKVVIEGVPFEYGGMFTVEIYNIWYENDAKIGTMCHLHSGKIGQTINGNELMNGCVDFKMANESKVVEINFKDHRGGAQEVILKVIRNPDFRPTDAPNGN